MKKYAGLTVVIITLLFSNYLLAGQDLKREFKLEYGKKVEIDLNTGGSIEIIGWNKELVSLTARSHDADIEEFKIEFDENSSGLHIHVSNLNHDGGSDIDLKLFVPEKCDLELETMGGDITTDNVAGTIEGKTMGGDLDLSKLKGEVELTTMGGDIHVENSELDGEVKTMGGDVTFQDVGGNVKGSTMGGDVEIRGTKNIVKKEVKISTMGGDINIDSAPGGADVHTMGGDITVRSAGTFVKAKTMGGDIVIDQLDGGAKVSTMGGDIDVTMIGDVKQGDRNVDLSSMGGDITVTLPQDLSIDFNIKLTYTKRSAGEYKISCDFPIKIEESADWDYSGGSARKYIIGTGKVGDGKYRVRLETTNGNITVKKG
jgi:DUF4097 and DUF4098 domain-containing protein YvlB